MKVAAWQYPIEAHGSFAAWHTKIDRAVEEAASSGAKLVVAPEYASMELTSLFPEATTLATQLDAMQTILGDYDAAYRDAAMRHRVAIVSGSFPVNRKNRALVHGANGEGVPVEKLQMTRFENEQWQIAAGAGQTVIELDAETRLGVAICYDSEFPLIVRRLVEAGANVIAVPSCTDTLAGYTRVRVACAARALENQCYVVQAPTVGIATWSIAVDENIGAAGVFAPPDRGFPDDGVVALGALNASQLLVADLDLAAIEAVRQSGAVFTHRDWSAPAHLAGGVARVSLR